MKELSVKDMRSNLRHDQSTVLKQLYTEYHDYCISNMMRKIGVDEEDAKDFFIEALLIFRRNVLEGRVEHLTSMKSYLLSTCLNLGKENFRRNNRPDAHKSEIEARLYPASEEEEQDNSRKRVALAAFDLLPENCQKILRLFYVQRTAMKDIAPELALANENVVKVQKARCLRKWEQSIEAMNDESITRGK